MERILLLAVVFLFPSLKLLGEAAEQEEETPLRGKGAEPTYHGERHAVDLMLVFGFVLSEWAVPAERRRHKQGFSRTEGENDESYTLKRSYSSPGGPNGNFPPFQEMYLQPVVNPGYVLSCLTITSPLGGSSIPAEKAQPVRGGRTHPLRSLNSMQPRENQSAVLS